MLPNGHRDAPWVFTPTPFVNGIRLAFVIAVTRGALRPELPDSKDTVVAVEDRWDRLPALCIWMTEPEVTFDRPVIGGPLPLDGGRQVWVAARVEPIDAIEPEPVPASAMIEPMSPESHGVAAPGILVRGVHLDDGHRPASTS